MQGGYDWKQEILDGELWPEELGEATARRRRQLGGVAMPGRG